MIYMTRKMKEAYWNINEIFYNYTTKKIQEIDEDIALVELMEIICQDIENKKYKEGNDVFKTTKTDNIAEIKKEYF